MNFNSCSGILPVGYGETASPCKKDITGIFSRQESARACRLRATPFESLEVLRLLELSLRRRQRHFCFPLATTSTQARKLAVKVLPREEESERGRAPSNLPALFRRTGAPPRYRCRWKLAGRAGDWSCLTTSCNWSNIWDERQTAKALLCREQCGHTSSKNRRCCGTECDRLQSPKQRFVDDLPSAPTVFITGGAPSGGAAENGMGPDPAFQEQQSEETKIRTLGSRLQSPDPSFRSFSEAVDCVRARHETMRIRLDLFGGGRHQRGQGKRGKLPAHQVSNRDSVTLRQPSNIAGKTFNPGCSYANGRQRE